MSLAFRYYPANAFLSMATLEDLKKALEAPLTGDNGDVSPEDTATFNILISQHREPLNTLALKLLTTFKRRCSWSIAVALSDLYEHLLKSNPLDIHSRLILIYLVFRVAELDGTDVNGTNLAKQGHLSLPFLLRIANGEAILPEKFATPVEKYLAKMILSAKVDTIASWSAERINQASQEYNTHILICFDQALGFYAKEKVRFPRSAEEKQREEILASLTSKLFSGKVLNMREHRILVEALSSAAPDSSLVDTFSNLSSKAISKLIEENMKIAAEAIYKLVERDVTTIDYYMSIIMEMELSVSSIEVVLKLYTGNLSPDRDALSTFVSYCLKACDDSSHALSKQSRQVRMVCMFVSNLLKKEILPVEEQMTELSNFVLQHSSHKETTALYQALTEARHRYTNKSS